jgi:hypothetical protein
VATGGVGSDGGTTTVSYASITIMTAANGQGGAGSTALAVVRGGGSTGSSTASGGGAILDSTTLDVAHNAGAAQPGSIGFGASGTSYSGQGGSCNFGIGGFPLVTAGAGTSASSACGGGAGALRSTTNVVGGSGADGLALFEWVL